MAYHRPDAESLVAAFASSDFTRDQDSWNQAVEEDKGPDELAIPEPDEDGNYTTPVLNRIIEALSDLDAGERDEDSIIELLDRAQEIVGNMLTVMQMCVEDGIDDPENPITQAIKTGFEEHTAAVERLKAYFYKKNEQDRTEGIIQLQAATNRLVDAYAFFQKLRNVALLVYCPSCGAENKRGDAKCVSCAINLPIFTETQQARLLAVAAEGVIQAEGAVPIKTPNYERIERAVNGWEGKDIDDDTFFAEIEAVEANMMAHKQANESERSELGDLSEEEQLVMNRLLDSVDQALDANVAALHTMKKYFTESDPDHLRKGFEAFGAATRQIVEAYMASQALMNQGSDEVA